MCERKPEGSCCSDKIRDKPLTELERACEVIESLTTCNLKLTSDKQALISENKRYEKNVKEIERILNLYPGGVVMTDDPTSDRCIVTYGDLMKIRDLIKEALSE